MSGIQRLVPISLISLLAACSSTGVSLDTSRHIEAHSSTSSDTTQPPALPPIVKAYGAQAPKPKHKQETYSVVVSNVKAQDLLFALARDAKVNVDIQAGITGNVTINALEQTLPQLLARISRQVDMRFELDGQNLVVMPDTPYLRNYKIDYVNLTRDTTSTVSVSSQIGAGASATTQAPAASSGSGSFAKIENTSRNRFWESLIQNVKDLLQETDKVFPEGAQEKTVESAATRKSVSTLPSVRISRAEELIPRSADTETTATRVEKTISFREAASVIANIEAGVLSIRATSRQHEKVQEFLDKVMNSAKRQVLIEATIAEVQLTQNYQQGINWSALNVFDSGLKIVQSATGLISGPSSTLLELGYNSSGGNFTSSIKLLESFGTVKVLSSPKLSVLNNQTAVMKVVDDNIYFTYEIDEREATQYAAAKTTVKSTMHSVPVGLVLTITPQVGDDDSVTLNIRPSLSRVIGQKIDPSIQLATSNATITNTIPIIRAREFDSVMRVNNGNIAVMGGLMEDLLSNMDDTVPGLGKTPIFGGLFQNKDDSKRKTELVIFVRPTVLRGSDTGYIQTQSKTLFAGQNFFDTATSPALFSNQGEQK